MSKLGSYYRRNQTAIMLSVIGVCFFAILLMQAHTIAQMQHQLEEIKRIAERQERNAKDRSDQIKAIDRHLDCMTIFFSQRNRDEKAIENIDRCEIAAANDESRQQRQFRLKQQNSQPVTEPTPRQETARTQPRKQPEREPTSQPERPVQPEEPEQPQPISGIPLLEEVINALGGS